MSDWLEAALGLYAAERSASAQETAARRAAEAQQAAAGQSIDLQREIYQQQQEDFAPYQAVGEDALYRQAALVGVIPTAPGVDQYAAFRESPGYQYQFTEGLRGLEQSAAQRGNLLSGQTAKDIVDYSQQAADINYQNYLNNLGILSGTGQQATGSLASLGSRYGAQAGAATQAAGAARASGYLGQGQAQSQRYQDYAGILGYYG